MYQLYNGDCLEVMKDIPDKSIDMILCDLPYGMTHNEWDVIIPFEPMWENINRIIKEDTPILFFANQPFTSLLVCSNLKAFKYSLVWEKNKGSDFLNVKRKPIKTNEDICIFYNKLPVYNPQYTYDKPYFRGPVKQETLDKSTNYGKTKPVVLQSLDGRRYPTTVLHFKRVEGKHLHPTQKPIELLEYLIKTYSNENSTILDFCMGSGSTGVACLNTNRNFIGIEKDESYFSLAKSRIDMLQEQSNEEFFE